MFHNLYIKLKNESFGSIIKRITYQVSLLLLLSSAICAHIIINTEGSNALLNKNIGIMLPFVLALFSLQITILNNNASALRNSKYNFTIIDNMQLIKAIVVCCSIELASMLAAVVSYLISFKDVPDFIKKLVENNFLSENFLDPVNLKLFFIDTVIIFSLLFMIYMITIWLYIYFNMQILAIKLAIKKKEIKQIDLTSDKKIKEGNQSTTDKKEDQSKADKEKDQPTVDKENSAVNTKSKTQKRKRKKAKKR